MRILVVNTGSTSLKLQVHSDRGGDHVGGHDDLPPDPSPPPDLPPDRPPDSQRPIAERHIEDWDGHDVGPIAALVHEHAPLDAIGHRVVHGGSEFLAPVLVDDDVQRRLGDLIPLAPLHQPRTLAGIAAARTVAPEVPQVACFDTAYHGSLPEAAAAYALPAEWRHRWPLKRYGFHGLSHAYAARRAAELTRAARSATASSELRVVTCHLGAGASLCASLGIRSVDTTMGFTPLEGLVMATRSGTVDPGLVLWLITEAGLAPDVVRRGLERSSGLVGLAGTADMRQVIAGCRSGDHVAQQAFDVYIHALGRHIAAMTAALAGLDILVFTAGVGEHAPDVRAAVASRLAYLDIKLDPELNGSATGMGDHDITYTPDAPVTTLVIEAREDLEIARQTRAALGR